MTREEAIKEIIRAYDVLDFSGHMDNRRKEAFNMARVALEQEPSGDVISRRAVLHIPLNLRNDDIINSLPPVTPKPKTGHWILRDDINGQYQCDGCGMFLGLDRFDVEEAGYELPKFCSNCGARMESEEQG